MQKQKIPTERGAQLSIDVAKRVLSTSRGADSRLPIVAKYFEQVPEARAEIESRLSLATSRAKISPAAAREIDLLRAEVLSRAAVHYAIEAVPSAQAQVRNALAHYLEELGRPAR